jgi:hypothetical protein
MKKSYYTMYKLFFWVYNVRRYKNVAEQENNVRRAKFRMNQAGSGKM